MPYKFQISIYTGDDFALTSIPSTIGERIFQFNRDSSGTPCSRERKTKDRWQEWSGTSRYLLNLVIHQLLACPNGFGFMNPIPID